MLSRLFLRPIIILAFDSKKVGIVGTFYENVGKKKEEDKKVGMVGKSRTTFKPVYEPHCEKTGLRGFRPGPTQTGLHNQ